MKLCASNAEKVSDGCAINMHSVRIWRHVGPRSAHLRVPVMMLEVVVALLKKDTDVSDRVWIEVKLQVVC